MSRKLKLIILLGLPVVVCLVLLATKICYAHAKLNRIEKICDFRNEFWFYDYECRDRGIPLKPPGALLEVERPMATRWQRFSTALFPTVNCVYLNNSSDEIYSELRTLDECETVIRLVITGNQDYLSDKLAAALIDLEHIRFVELDSFIPESQLSQLNNNNINGVQFVRFQFYPDKSYFKPRDFDLFGE